MRILLLALTLIVGRAAAAEPFLMFVAKCQ
jgi:hypothetical protein